MSVKGRKMSFNTVGFTILGIPPYFFCAVVGLVAAVCLNIILVSSKKYCLKEHMRVLIISIISMMVLAKLFGCISGAYRAIGVGELITFDTIKNTGIVFYGGLFGLLLAYYCGIKSRLITVKDPHAMDVLAVCIPLFHAIARTGCFLAGCCYGIESNIFAIRYTMMDDRVVNTANRIPVQLIEALYNIGLFFYLFICIRKDGWENKNLLLRYIMFYSCGRFLLEFIRGDTVRGVIYGVSFSQMISIIIWLTIFIYIIKNKSKAKENDV